MRAARTGLWLVALVAAALGSAPAARAQAPRDQTDSLYNLVAAPSAAFVWFPAFPKVGERVSLVSTSTDLFSPITSYGWDLTSFGAFAAGDSAITTTFSTPANHTVGMQVTARDGRSSVATRTIVMSPPAAGVMNPFPIVRIVGLDFRYGTKIRLLSVKAPAHALIRVECRGRGCHGKSVRRVVPSSRRGETSIAFRRFERLLSPGASLRIRVSQGTLIGSYTHFTIRHRRLPVRVDSCLSPAGIKPILCPS